MSAEIPSPAQQLTQLQHQMRHCRRCVQAGFFVEGPAVFSGTICARILFVGQAPAKADLDAGSVPWSGAGGARLMAWLADAGFDPDRMRSEHYYSAITRCYPGKGAGGRGDRVPGAREIASCRSFLRSELALIYPSLLVPVGRLAIESFLGAGRLVDRIGYAFLAEKHLKSEWQGCLPHDVWLIPLPHPSGANLWLNQPRHQQLVRQAIDVLSDVRQRLGL